MKLIETSHGTVCSKCLLWPDLCTCDGWLMRFLHRAFDAAASRPSDKALRAQILAALHPLHDPARLGTVESFRTLSKVTP